MFPLDRPIRVSKDGVINFSAAQWTYLLKVKKVKSKSLKVQQRVIKKFVEEALMEGIKRK